MQFVSSHVRCQASLRVACRRVVHAAIAAGSISAVAVAAVAEDVPSGWLATVEQRIASEEYHVTWQARTALPDVAEAWQSPNRAQGLRTYFTARGIRVIPRDTSPDEVSAWEWSLSLVGYGAGRRSWAVPQAELSAEDNRVEYFRGGLTEWYVNEPRGLKQGFTLPAPPEAFARGRGAEVLGVSAVASRALAVAVQDLIHLDFELDGNLRPSISADGRSIDFLSASGAQAVRYDGLVVTDATGRELVSWMEGVAVEPVRGIRIVIEARDAVYPVTVDPLASSPAWTAESDQANAEFGYAVATAGDVNGDGYSDVIVASRNYDNGQSNEGRAYVYLGSASGLVAAAAWTAESDQANSEFGSSVATAGDANGDGYSDVIVGAGFYSNGHSGEGRAYVYLGSAEGLAAAAAWTAESDQVGAGLGSSVGTAGDVNGDGYSDVIVGAYGYNNPQADEGRAHVYLGSASGPGVSPAWTVESDQAGAVLGKSVGTAGDVNGDGYSDVIVGAASYDNVQADEGRAYVYLGSGSGLGAAPAWTAESDQANGQFGSSVGTAGDVNGDGYSDVIVGAYAYGNGEATEGRAYVFLGSASGPDATAAWTAESNQASAVFGFSVGTAGDVNGDGYADVIVGARLHDNGQNDEGRAYVYLGSASGPGSAAAWTAESDQASAYFGYSVGTAGDVNADGYSDVVVGAYQFDNGQTNEGRAHVYLGAATGLGATAAWFSEGELGSVSYLGYSVATAGDVNGDGYWDVIVGAVGGVGTALIHHGSPAGLDTTADWVEDGPQNVSFYGASVATAGDVNGDGYSDVIVGAPQYDCGQFDKGRVYLYHGSASGLSHTAAWTQAGNQDGAYFGNSVATAGDVNGDGYSDVIVGSRGADNDQLAEGRAYLYYGSPSGLGGVAAWTGEGNQNTANYGISVASAGDVNGDSFSDVIVGAYRTDCGQVDEGLAYVYHGSASGLSLAWTGQSDQAGARYGGSVASAGDVNGDGFSDVIIGAYLDDNGEADEGRAYVYLGSASGLGITAAWTAEVNESGSNFGTSVASAGDVNGDGFSDVIIGADAHNPTNEGCAFVFLGSASGLGTTATWTGESNQSAANYGYSVASAGDVNADGYSDVIVGAYTYDSDAADTGRAYVYLGNAGGVSLVPQQRRVDDAAAITPGGRSDASDSVRLVAVGRTPFGRAPVRLEWEVKPLGTLFDGAETGVSAEAADSGVAGAGLNELVGGLSPDTSYHWRVRTLYDPAATPFQPAGGWFTIARGGWNETLFATACATPGEAVYIHGARRDPDDGDHVIFDFQDPNRPPAITGYNVYRAAQPWLDHAVWPIVGSNVTDADGTTPDEQWIDTTGDVSVTWIWYYEIAPYHAGCVAEGPW